MNQPVAELRTDWLTGRSVLIAEHRALRPNEFAEPDLTCTTSVVANQAGKTIRPGCPFCAGNESRTPQAVYESRDGHGRWQVRIVPNLYPAVTPGGEMTGRPSAAAAKDAWSASASPAIGAHELIIESANHIERTSALSVDELRLVLEAYAVRLRDWRQMGRYRYGLVFKNQGPQAGASISHLHSQLIALPSVPAAIAAEQERASQSFSEKRQCPYCFLAAQEQSIAKRIVLDRDGFIAFCPYASWQPCEVWLMPTDHRPSFESATPGELDRLTGALHPLIERFESIVPHSAYNLLLRTAPWTVGCDGFSHWRIELLPRVSAFAGLELATGIHINPLAPESAAGQLRND